ncbi:MAG: glycosyltransferase family 2 protein [Mogibacterium sp.]|nr:glycosyltransferase family 2 protein [Mogibacterium sp.]
MNKNYRISVIIPVYNVQDYLEECLASEIGQTIGFECIQVILVNDGSPDGSAAICKKYAADYPENIIYVEQPNSGVAAARNMGLEHADGELITFLDGDDKWSEDSFETAYKAYTEHPDIPVFSCRMVFFDGESGDHQLNYKYEEDRIIDIREDYNFPQLSSSSVFIKADVARKYRFTEGLKYSEDFRYINEVLLEHPKMMVLKDPVYWYRRRPSGDSAIQKSVTDPDYYTYTCRQVYVYLFNRSKKLFGQVLRYIQFCVMYDLRWRLKIPLAETGLNNKERAEYFDLLVQLLHEIDDDIILEQKRIALALQLYALELKHGGDISDRICIDNAGIIRYEDYPIFDLSRQPVIRIDSIALDHSAVLNGQINYPFDDDRFKMYYSLNGIRYEIETRPSQENKKTYLKGILKSNLEYVIDIPVDYSVLNEIYFIVCFAGKDFITIPEYMTSSAIDRKTGELIKGKHTAYRRDQCLYITRYSQLDSFSRKIKRKLSR